MGYSTIDDTNLPICRHADVDPARSRASPRACGREARTCRARGCTCVRCAHTCGRGYLRYLWAIFPIQLLLSKPLPVQHVRNKKLDKIISTSRHGFDSLKLVKSYGAGIRGILFYFLSIRARARALSHTLAHAILSRTLRFPPVFSLFLSMPPFCYPSVETPDGQPGIDPPRAHKSAISLHDGEEDVSRFPSTIFFDGALRPSAAIWRPPFPGFQEESRGPRRVLTRVAEI